VESLGWHGPVYVLPGEVIGNAGEHVVFQNAHAIEAGFSVAGTVDEWRDNIAALAQGNSRMVFAVCIALAGALLEPAGEDSGGFHLRGPSSIGKSTALKLGASVWGNPSSYCRTWRATSNGLEGLAALHNDGLLILDELSQIDPKEAGEAAYLLANGKGKARASRNGTARQSGSWRLIFLSAGEESLPALMARAGRKATAGQEIRLAEIDADAGAGNGALEELHEYDNPAALTVALRDLTTKNYGATGAEWLRLLQVDRAKLPALLVNGIRRFTEEFAPANYGGQIGRVARRFALVAVAEEMATLYGLTGWTEGEATTAVGKCFQSWLGLFGGTGNREERTLLNQVRGFVEKNGASRFQRLDNEDQQVRDRAGFIRAADDGTTEYLVLTDTFRSEVCSGFDHKYAIKVLQNHGWLASGHGDRDTQRLKKAPGMKSPGSMCSRGKCGMKVVRNEPRFPRRSLATCSRKRGNSENRENRQYPCEFVGSQPSFGG
jgi:putative DNA primase/helicase